MRARRLILIIAMAALLAACNLGVPQVTPTVAPTRTPSITPSARFTATASLTPSRTPSATPLPTRIAQQPASQTPTSAPSETTATLTITFTATATVSRTPAPSVTPTSTSSATPTRTPSQTVTPTATRTPTATSTPLPPSPTLLPTIGLTDTPTMTRPPTLTPLPTLTNTPAAPLPTFTRTLSPTEIAIALGTFAPTATSVAPTASPTGTLAPPTLDVTPTFVTAEAETPAANFPPVLNTSIPAVLAPTETAQPEPALPTFTASPPSAQLQGFQPNLNQLQAFALGGSGGAPFTLLDNVNVALFERNPLNPAQYAVTDSSGLLYFTGVNGQNASRPDISPFSRFLPLSRDENNAYVSDIAWSPDGRFLAFLVDGDKEANDGVWFFGPNLPDTFAPIQLLVDCHKPDHPGCAIVTRPSGPDQWESLSLEWSPTSDALLVRTELPLAGRAGLTIVPFNRDERARDVRPPALLYEYGSWENNGNRILVSGRGPDDNVYIGWVNRDGSFNELVFAARDAGLWVQNAVQRPDGSIVTLGAPLSEGGPNGVMRLYNASGQALTGVIGNAPPSRVEWSPDRSAVLVAAGGRFYLATANGAVNDITDQVGGAQAINWVNGSLPVGEPLPAVPETDFAPVGQASGGSSPRFAPGANLRVINTTDCLNLRDAPNTGAQIIACLVGGEPVQVLDGASVREGVFVWWPVQALGSGLRGWVAGEINGVPQIGL